MGVEGGGAASYPPRWGFVFLVLREFPFIASFVILRTRVSVILDGLEKEVALKEFP